MELIIKKDLQEQGHIEWNNEELKKEMQESLAHYNNLVYTDEQIGEAKKDRANLRKFAKALDDKRKEVKAKCLEPYNVFEKQLKELMDVVNEPIALIDKQVKEHEEFQKQEKEKAVKELYSSVEFPEWLNISRIFDNKWLNASVSLKSVKKDMATIKEKIESDLETLKVVPNSEMAMEVYKKCLDVNTSINKAKEAAELAKIAEQKADEVEVKGPEIEVKEVATQEPIVTENVEEIKSEVTFKAWITVEQATELNRWFTEKGIEFEVL